LIGIGAAGERVVKVLFIGEGLEFAIETMQRLVLLTHWLKHQVFK